MLEKSKTNQYMLYLAICLVGMLSVSITHLFGGYYSAVAAIVTVLGTLLFYNLFDKKETFSSDLVTNVVALIIIGCQLVFFVVNDIFNYPVYVKNHLGFWGVTVIISQIISILGILYFIIMLVISLNKDRIELVSEDDKKSENENLNFNDSDSVYSQENKTDDVEEKTIRKEIRSIPEKINNVKAPFMEEEK